MRKRKLSMRNNLEGVRKSMRQNTYKEKADKFDTKPWFNNQRLDMVYISFYNPRIAFYNQGNS
jgi:hypothetical protein